MIKFYRAFYFGFFFVFLAKPAMGQNVLDMYFQIPSQFLGRIQHPDEPQTKDRKFRKDALKTIDIKNGFLQTKNGTQIVKFSREKSSPMIAISGGSYAEDGRPKRIELFAKTKDNKWQSVTPFYFAPLHDIVIDALYKRKCPNIPQDRLTDSASGTYRLNLPRKGKKIVAVVESDSVAHKCKEPLFSMSFDGIRFVMSLD